MLIVFSIPCPVQDRNLCFGWAKNKNKNCCTQLHKTLCAGTLDASVIPGGVNSGNEGARESEL